jgi:hypothetical protein
MDTSLKDVMTQLEQVFSKLNERFFDNQLEKPVLTISPDITKGSYGWCTSKRVWKEKEEAEGYYEINICAEYLNRSFQEICETLQHEMVHLLNLQNEVKDTSRRGTYHNKKFKQTAEEHEMITEQDAKYGWCITKLTPVALDFINSLNGETINLFRTKDTKVKTSVSRVKKYICPNCGTKVKATKEVNIICADCSTDFQQEEGEE